jgi:hypothetical protein
MSATHRITVNFHGVDHWHWSLNGGADSMVMSGNTVEINAPDGGALIVKGVDSNHIVLATDSATLDAPSGGLPTLPEDFVTAQQACNAAANLDGYLYDEDHYVIRYAAVERSGLFTARGCVYEFYCYGSASSFVTNLHDFEPFYTLQDKTLSLFNTSICVGWARWGYSAQIGGISMAAFGLVYDGVRNSIQLHTLDTPYTSGANSFSQNYRQYIHPQNCSLSNSLDRYDTNSAASSERGVINENNGGLTSHIEALQGSNSTDLEQISIYPIKKI